MRLLERRETSRGAVELWCPTKGEVVSFLLRRVFSDGRNEVRFLSSLPEKAWQEYLQASKVA